MALSGLSTRRTRRIFTTLMALDLKESIGRFERSSNIWGVLWGQMDFTHSFLFEILHSLRLLRTVRESALCYGTWAV